MNRDELAAEVLRIHDLVAADPEPKTPEEWHAICQSVAAVSEACMSHKVTAMRQPQPHMVDGVGLCSVHCSHYTHSSVHDRVCNKTGEHTLALVPCRPWVDEIKRQALASELQVESKRKWVAELQQELANKRAERNGILRRAEHADALNRKLQERIHAMLPDVVPDVVAHHQAPSSLPYEHAPVAQATCVVDDGPVEMQGAPGEFDEPLQEQAYCWDGRPAEPTHARLCVAAPQPTTAVPKACTYWMGDRHCDDVTICRNTSGYPLCGAHGGRQPGERTV